MVISTKNIVNDITEEQIERFNREGFLLLKSFYSPNIIEKLIEEIKSICSLLLGSRISDPNVKLGKNLEDYYGFLCGVDYTLHKILYDSLKNLPSFMQIVSSDRNIALASTILKSSFVGIASRSYGIRIDKPYDDVHRTDWHQDFHFHARSKKGLVFWIPLMDICSKIGPLEVIPGTHKLGVLPLVDKRDATLESTEYTKIANAVKIKDIDQILNSFKTQSVCCELSDLLVFDYNLLHRSGFNQSNNARWSVQIRYFDFSDSWGIENGWKGSITSGISYENVIPEYILKGEI